MDKPSTTFEKQVVFHAKISVKSLFILYKGISMGKIRVVSLSYTKKERTADEVCNRGQFLGGFPRG